MRVHFIAIGGSAMHNLAIALHNNGFIVSGSDDEITEPSKSRLIAQGLFPDQMGWNERRINLELDAVILGMHARDDNPELMRAIQLGIPIYSYPAYIYENAKDKNRIVISGSHGKTTITSMILHAFRFANIDIDFMVGAKLQGFDTMVKLTKGNKNIVIEGDEYLSSPIDRRPKFHLYKPHIALISGIAWDHINVFPTFENYVDQFKKFIDLIEPNGILFYCELDTTLVGMLPKRDDIKMIPYGIPNHFIENGITYLENPETPLKIFGLHNLMNLNGAQLVCEQLGIDKGKFYQAMAEFTGAEKRMELIGENTTTKIYKDFAHSPSKLMATLNALRSQFPHRKLIACMELHTFSSLTKTFLLEYNATMANASCAMVYFNPKTIEHKKLIPITEKDVLEGFGGDNIIITTNTNEILKFLHQQNWHESNLLLMSSGNFDGLDLQKVIQLVLGA